MDNNNTTIQGNVLRSFSECALTNNSCNISFQVLDITQVKLPNMCMLYMFAVTGTGLSICCRIKNFFPYIYADFDGFDPIQLRMKINEDLQIITDYRIISINIVECNSIYGYNNKSRKFLKITYGHTSLVNSICEKLHSYGITKIFEKNVNLVTRFLVDTGIMGCSWVRIPSMQYTVVSKTSKHTYCHEEIETTYQCLKVIFKGNNLSDTKSGDTEENKKSRKEFFLNSSSTNVIEKSWICLKQQIPEQQVLTTIEPATGTNNVARTENNSKSHCKKIIGNISVKLDNKCSLSSKNEEKECQNAPITLLSFDIEIAGRSGVFPQPNKDPVVTIASVITFDALSATDVNYSKYVFIVGDCEELPDDDVVIETCVDEKTLLLRWAHFVRQFDPDVLTGYNIDNFDFKYLFERADLLNIPSFARIGRERKSFARTTRKTNTSSSEFFQQHETKISGRVVIDMYTCIRREHKLRSFKLDDVAQHFLGERKKDVHYSEIKALHAGNKASRRKLADYCLQDALLPLRLMSKLMTLSNYVEMSKVTGVLPRALVSRGQQVKVFALLLRYARSRGFIVPSSSPFACTTTTSKAVHRSDTGESHSYSGGLVLNPVKGFHKEPVTVLDFSSLYPSIMIAYNLCYSTLFCSENSTSCFRKESSSTVSKEEKGTHPTKKYEQSIETNKAPTGAEFVKKNVRLGILPQILCDLLEQRKATKCLLKKEDDPDKRRVLDGRQLALKTTANAIYGFTGAQNGLLPCLQLSESVTSYGRCIIESAKTLVETRYKVDNGYDTNATIIYGDTDSVMVSFGVKTIAEAIKIGREAAEYVTRKISLFPITLDFEKVFHPFLLISKKRYAGLSFTSTIDCASISPSTELNIDTTVVEVSGSRYCNKQNDTLVLADNNEVISNKRNTTKSCGGILECKGIEVVRRDNCQLVSDTISKCLFALFTEKDEVNAIQICKQVVNDLYHEKIDIRQLIISKEFGDKEYKAKQAHVELAKRLAKRSPGSEPKFGDRVPFVIISSVNNRDPLHTRSEDPEYVVQNNLQIDYDYYFRRQLLKPLFRIFEPIVKSEEKFVTMLINSKKFFDSTERCNKRCVTKKRKSVQTEMGSSQRQITMYFKRTKLA